MHDDTFYDSLGLHRIKTSRLSTVYRHSGRDWQDAESIFFIHGSLASGRWWEPALAAFEELMPNKYACYAPDLRSHGQADPLPVQGMESLSADMLSVMDAIGLKKAHLVGWSMGGGVATQLALDHPNRCLSLTLVSSVLPDGVERGQLRGDPEAMGQAIRRGELETVSKLIRASNLREGRFPLDNSPPGNALVSYLVQSAMQAQNYPGDTEHGEGNHEAMYRFNVTGRCATFPRPVLNIYGDHDIFASREDFARAGRFWPPDRYHEVIFEGASHSPMVEQPRRFVITLDDFFSRI
jgi:pimeloyl-ACP methyl ester carboxylesterase